MDLVAGTEDTRHAGDELLSVLHEGIHGLIFGAVLGFRSVVDRLPQIHALAAEHHGADGNALQFLVQVGDDEGGLEGADSARFIVARQELDGVFSGQKRESGVVLEGHAGEFRGGLVR